MARALLAAAALVGAAATPVLADRPDARPELRDDGTVVYAGTTYPTLAAWYASDAFRASGARGDSAGSIWQRAGTLRVLRQEPAITARGKQLSLHRERAVT